MRTVEVTTDAGKAYLKALGNPEGPHPLACEWIATNLAAWFGLKTFECAIVTVEEWNEIPFSDGGQAAVGPAFVTKAMRGHGWGGSAVELQRIENPPDLSRLIVFDTWLLNCDRYCIRSGHVRCNRDNLFLGRDQADATLAAIAMDHSHCFTCGRSLTTRIADLDRIRDPTIYGAFPEFHDFFDLISVAESLRRLREINRGLLDRLMRQLPREWEVPPTVLAAWTRFILGRAAHLADWRVEAFCPVVDGPTRNGEH